MNPIISIENLSFQYDDSPRPVFIDLNLTIPPGVTSLVGPNGSGKTTLMLLAGGRLLPDTGTVTILERPTSRLSDEESRNLLVSFIYQNMEFETVEPVHALMDQIYTSGAHTNKEDDLVTELIKTFDLEQESRKRTQELSKGALQRSIIAFSLLYGSPVVMMDEPVFALETERKERIMAYLVEYAKKNGTSFLYSAHELPLSRTYSDHALLFSKNGFMEQGSPAQVLNDEKLEAAYGVPAAMLREKEQLHRTHLREVSEHLREE